MADVIITEFTDRGPVERLKADFDVHWDDGLWDKPEELRKLAAGAKAIIVRNRTQVDVALLDAAPELRVIGRLGVGLDNIDLKACKARGVRVCPAIGANAISVAEYVIACAMVLLRGPALRGTGRLTAGEWPRQEFGNGREIAGRTIGIIGFGSIGQVTAQRARAMGMEVMAYDAMLPESDEAWANTAHVSLATIFDDADVISLHCPLTPATRGLIGAAELKRMKHGAVLINAARGGIVDEAACAAALRSGHLRGAALDTFDAEPIDAASAKLFAGLPNVILTPHIAGITVEANYRISDITVDNVRRVLKAAS